MFPLFYFSRKKKLDGPYSQNQILEYILRGKIDLSRECQVASQKNKKNLKPPRPIYQIKEFQEFFPQKKDDKDTWVLLRKHNNNFIQSGPYLKKGLQVLLQRGLVSDQDFVWKEQFSSWKRLSVCQEFHTRMDATIEDLMDQFSEKCPEHFNSKVTYYKKPTYPSWSKWRK